ncbi:AfsR/SARP family transcriptional regulator [Actinomadura rudentiformis]|uniref:AfsR family transcriptional regulator n=1 Tax=Actinomadura rudentiformis TaxID=359158 RepID=A0A6H9Y6M0_9ACTN|nr:AfsR/SARP family transcriptional regulator [Actinomadura rudentiformis]KAB2339990.1 AfsR family transcriptional regulator [Actinomadura rudentiformis]
MVTAQFRLLGSVEIANGRHTFALPATKPSVVLAALLLHANEFLSNERLIEIVWGEENPRAPRNPRSSLQTYVMRSRQTLHANGVPGNPILTLPSGYTLEASPETLDLLRFRQLLERARRGAGDLEESLRLQEALALWRGPALANIPSDVLHREEVPKLTEEWLGACERRIDIELSLGRHRSLTAELHGLTAAHPHRERYWEQLMEALYRAGRQSEALAAYRKIKGILLEQLGVDPGPGLQRMELAILKGELPVSDPAPDKAADPARVSPRPAARSLGPSCRLPPPDRGFVGHSKIASRIADELTRVADQESAVVTVIRGAPGVGKSALALRVAYDVADLFPEGQWYLRLSDDSGRPRPPQELLGELLVFAGLRRPAIPEGQAERQAAFRTALVDRRILLLLDDAVDARHVEPLLPGSAGMAVLVTSRTNLAELTARWRLRSHQLDALPVDGSLELLAGLLGRMTVDRNRAAAVTLAEICGGLPLALRIAAAKFTSRPGQSLGEFVSWIAADPLGRLSVGRRPRISVRRAFDLSSERLGPEARRLLNAIAEARTGPVFSVEDVARLTGTRSRHAEELLEELFEAGLLQGLDLDRFSMPPLLRSYARELRADGETPRVAGTTVAR